jgi:hypothetical protein
MSDDRMRGLQIEVAALRNDVDELLDLVEDLTRQGCAIDDDGTVDSMALSAYADGLRTLAAAGRYEILTEHGRRVIAKRVSHG